MKKIFPWVVVLLSFSLIGIIFIQYNWIKNAVNLREKQYEKRMVMALDNIRSEIVNNEHLPNKNPSDPLSSQNHPWQTIFRGFSPNSIIPVHIRYSSNEIHSIIKRNLEAQGFDVPFEYAVLSIYPYNVAQLELYSDHYFVAFRDSASHKQFKTPLVASQSGVSAMMNTSFEMLNIIVPTDNYITTILHSLKWIIGGSVLFTLILITAFALTIFVMLRQKKLSAIKSDFINNMTHEFKTPLATISLAVDAIGNDKVFNKKEKIHYFAGIIKAENRRMLKQVETILQSALLEREEIKLDLQKINAHDVISKAVHNMELQMKSKSGRIETELHAENANLRVDEVHFSNIISNLLDNAIKYAKEDPVVRVETYNHKKNLVIAISDNGIGMNKETQARIFEKFYRAHTGNLHDVKGFGLGLAYVKKIVDEHKGKIKVESALGKGSKFEIEMPLEENGSLD